MFEDQKEMLGHSTASRGRSKCSEITRSRGQSWVPVGLIYIEVNLRLDIIGSSAVKTIYSQEVSFCLLMFED
jgi:hypothetical protein